MKKWILILAVFALFISCEEKKGDPSVRAYLSTDYDYYYVALGTDNGTTYTAKTEWLYTKGGAFSPYISVPSGSYNIIYDGDSDHSSAYVSRIIYSFESGKKYTIFYDGSIGLSED